MDNYYSFEPVEKPQETVIDAIPEKILISLMYRPGMTFNELWNKKGRSNRFAYHVKKLQESNLIKKDDQGKYKLTTKGKKRVAYLESLTGDRCELPIVAVIILVTDGDKVLLYERAKEPFYGYWGAHGGKLRSTNYILEQARESIKKETGLECDLELKGLFSAKTYADDDIFYGHQLFVLKGSNPRGKLLKSTKKGTHRWVKKDEVSKLRILPNIPHLIKIIDSERFRWIEADRFQKKDTFSMKIRKDITL
ncbi:hypothetical protein COV20_00370 [Candidatus Woesearchaeota archaeon CG10_big_fil_rev_8_21_14_0_10_45_16]|nr:MAG: hypothetical protein COV20_00370 [Candidatus Woesearchaeota archaeon CG10_big_fil_rev_8_21_14_0_10_45_16]